MRPFHQIDVFTDELGLGNPVAVVHDADGLDDEALAAFARWTHLSETTFLLPPSDPAADYRVRIFTVERELPFAGHPTLGSARAWLAAGGVPRDPERLVQECGVGLVRIRRDGDRLAFAAPPLIRSGPVSEDDLAPVLTMLGVDRDAVVDAAWCDNGPGWLGVLLADADAVLAVRPTPSDAPSARDVGIVGPYPDAGPGEPAFELRALISGQVEDPVTGSLNAAVAQWLIGSGRAPASYLASQGTVLQRRGRIVVESEGADVWIGGDTVIGISGTVAV